MLSPDPAENGDDCFECGRRVPFGDEGAERCQLCRVAIHASCGACLEAWTTYVCRRCAPHVNNARREAERSEPEPLPSKRILLRRGVSPSGAARVVDVDARILARGAAVVSLRHESWVDGERRHRYLQVTEDTEGVEECFEVYEDAYERMHRLCERSVCFRRHEFEHFVVYEFPTCCIQCVEFDGEEEAAAFLSECAEAGHTDISRAFATNAEMFAASG